MRFTYANVGAPVEIVSLRVTAVGMLTAPEIPLASPDGSGSPAGARRVWSEDPWCELPVWRRTDVAEETEVIGPAIIEED